MKKNIQLEMEKHSQFLFSPKLLNVSIIGIRYIKLIPVRVRIIEALGLDRVSKKPIQFEFWVHQFGWKNRESFSHVLFLQVCYISCGHFNSCKFVMVD